MRKVFQPLVKMTCKKCSKKKALFVLIPVLIAVVVLIACILFIFVWNAGGKKGQLRIGSFRRGNISGCHYDCTKPVIEMRAWMDKYSHPCDDFYEFACGKFKSRSLPGERKFYSRRDLAEDRIDEKIKEDILEKPAKAGDSISLNRTKDIYKICLNAYHTDLPTQGRTLRSVLSRSGLGEWPILEPEWKDCRPDLEWRMAVLNARGVDSLVRMEVTHRMEDLRIQAVISIADPLIHDICDDDDDTASSALERDNSVRHRAMLRKVLQDLDLEWTNTTDIEIDEILEFDFLFCNATKTFRQRRKTGNIDEKTTLMDLADFIYDVNWMRWRNMVFEDLRLSFPHEKHNLYVEALDPSIEAINDLLNDTTTKVQANYLTWRLVYHYMSLVGKDFRLLVGDYDASVDSNPLRLFRYHAPERNCVTFLKKLMPVAMIKRFHYISGGIQVEKKMNEIVTSVKIAFKDIFNKTLSNWDCYDSTWKVNKIKVILGYPKEKDNTTVVRYPFLGFPRIPRKTPELVTRMPKDLEELLFGKSLKDIQGGTKCKNVTSKVDDNIDGVYVKVGFYDSFYSDMRPLKKLSFLEAGMEVMIYRFRKQMEGVFKKKTLLSMEYAIQTLFSPFDLASYSFFLNDSIIISPGLVHSQIEHPNLPTFKTFSTLGWTIGKELARAFDIDSLKNSTGMKWRHWNETIREEAEKAEMCFKSFYNYSGNEDNLEGFTNEDYCDNQAMHLAFQAYRKYSYKNISAEAALLSHHDLPKTSEELFFLSYVQQFCEKWKNDPKPQSDGSSVRVSGKQRVNQVLRNLPEFSQVFNCSVFLDAGMVPEERCKLIWQ